MIRGNLGTNVLSTVGSGGESSGVRWGSISTASAAYRPYNSPVCYRGATHRLGSGAFQGVLSPHAPVTVGPRHIDCGTVDLLQAVRC